MRKLIAKAAIACALCFGPVTSLAPTATAQTALEKDLALFLDWFPGRFDNSLQVFWEPSLGVEEENRHEHIHSIFKPVDLPAFGEHVFYVEQYLNGDPSDIYRQRIYVFSADAEADAIRLQIYTPNDVENLVGAYKDEALLKDLTPEDARTRAGCDVFWKRQANQFLGYMEDGACRFTSQRSGKEIIIHDDLVLTENEIWIADRAETVDGEYVFGNKAGVPHKLRKARPFTCWTAVLKGAEHGDSGEGLKDWDFKTGGMLHDQQGDLIIETDETPSRTVRLRLRRVEWPTGSNRPSMTLYVHEGDSERATSYAWTEYDAERIGINLRWLQASCSHTPESLFDF